MVVLAVQIVVMSKVCGDSGNASTCNANNVLVVLVMCGGSGSAGNYSVSNVW